MAAPASAASVSAPASAPASAASSSSSSLPPLQFYSKSADPVARELSTFAHSPICLGGRWYPTVEHAYQADKLYCAYLFTGSELFSTRSPDNVHPTVGPNGIDAKKAASKATMKEMKITLDLSEWTRERQTESMLRALRAKFAIPKFAALLKSTGSRPLHHFERRPGYWGCQVRRETGELIGQNTLGRMLEGLRAEANTRAASCTHDTMVSTSGHMTNNNNSRRVITEWKCYKCGAHGMGAPLPRPCLHPQVCHVTFHSDHRDSLVESWECTKCHVVKENTDIPLYSVLLPRVPCDESRRHELIKCDYRDPETGCLEHTMICKHCRRRGLADEAAAMTN